jgi:tripartite-type tricarboxylate transporter receptor subunit TctC
MKNVKFPRRKFLHLAAGAVALPAVSQIARAQSYPTRRITIVVPLPPGGNVDLVVRILADRLSSSLGQPVVVEHYPGGAGGTIGAKTVASANPDGHTLLFSTPGPLSVATAVYKNLGYDPIKSFAPVAAIMSSPQMLVVNPTVPVKSMQELVSYAKANPGKIDFASPGYGSQPHLLGEMFKLLTGTNIVHVPYRGPAQATTDVLGGQVKMYFQTPSLLLPHIEAGKLTPLAVADEVRSPQLPTVPTTIESGFPKLQATFWAGIVAPAGTSASIVNRLNALINEILKSAELQASLASLSAKTKIGTPQEFADFMAAETLKWTEVANTAGIKAE